MWKWREDEYTRIGGDKIYSAHDIQWSQSREGAFWIPWAIDSTSSKNAMLVDAATGAVLRTLVTAHGTAADVNHIQLLANGIAKYNLTGANSSGELLWVVGGEYGEWPIT